MKTWRIYLKKKTNKQITKMLTGWAVSFKNNLNSFTNQTVYTAKQRDLCQYLRTHYSPNPIKVKWEQVGASVGLGEGWVCSCLETDFDLKSFKPTLSPNNLRSSRIRLATIPRGCEIFISLGYVFWSTLLMNEQF